MLPGSLVTYKPDVSRLTLALPLLLSGCASETLPEPPRHQAEDLVRMRDKHERERQPLLDRIDGALLIVTTS